MNKQQRISAIKKIADEAETLMQVANQVMATAARLQSEATTALNELGGSEGRHRKVVKNVLDEKQKLQIRASITKNAMPYGVKR